MYFPTALAICWCWTSPRGSPPEGHPGACTRAAGAGRWRQAPTLVLSDMLGATRRGVANGWWRASPKPQRLVCGVNLPMLLRALCYRHEDVDSLVSRAVGMVAKPASCRWPPAWRPQPDTLQIP